MAEGEASSKDNKFVKRLDFSSGNVASAWKIFKGQFKIFRIAKKYGDMSEEEQICNMLVQMGQDSVPIYEQFRFDTDNPRNLANTIKQFDEYFEPVRNVLFERIKFNRLTQGESPIHQFIVKLQNQAEYCEFGAVKDELIRDRIIVGCKDPKLTEYLIDLEDLNLQKCIQKSKLYTSNHSQSRQQIQSQASENVDSVGSKKTQSVSRKSSSGISAENPCPNCGKTFHKNSRCPAAETECRKCNVKGHWANSKVCKSQKSKNVNAVERTETISTTDTAEALEGLYLCSEEL